MQITMQGKYVTRDGRPVRILATDFQDGHDGTIVIGIVPGVSIKGDRLLSWDMCGNSNSSSSFDLIPVPTLHHGYIIISKDESPAIFLQTVFHMRQKAEDCRLDAAYPEAWIVVPLDWES